MTVADDFLAQLAGAAPADRKPLEDVLQKMWRDGQAAWPAVVLPQAAFLRHLAARLPRDAADLPAALGALHAVDLFLACACSAGDPRALEIFHRDFVSPVSRYLASRDFRPSLGDDVKQLLCQELLIAGEG